MTYQIWSINFGPYKTLELNFRCQGSALGQCAEIGHSLILLVTLGVVTDIWIEIFCDSTIIYDLFGSLPYTHLDWRTYCAIDL